MRFLPLDVTKENIIRASKQGARKIFFVDPNFTANHRHCESVCDLIIELKQEKKISKNISFETQARIDLVNKKLLEKMAGAGFSCLYLGIENISSRLLRDDIKKNNYLTAKDILKKINLISRFGIKPFVYLILGIPTTTPKEFKENIKFAVTLRKNKIPIEISPFIVPFPETEYFSIYQNTPLIKYNKVVFKRFTGNKVNLFITKTPAFLLPENLSVKNMLLNLEKKTNKIVEKQNISFPYVFIREAEKLVKKFI